MIIEIPRGYTFVKDKSIISVYKGIVLGLKPGVTTLKVISNENKNIYDEIEITVNKHVSESVNQEDLDYVNNIISKNRPHKTTIK